MSQKPLTRKEAIRTIAAIKKHGGNQTQAGISLGLGSSTVARRITSIKVLYPDLKLIGLNEHRGGTTPGPRGIDDVLARLRKSPMSIASIAKMMQCTRKEAITALQDKRHEGANLHAAGDTWSVEKAPPLRRANANARHDLVSNAKHEFQFGFVTDNHLGSKYARLDVLNDLYERFAKRGITQVFNAGNYIDGEARFNKFDLEVHGMDAQLRFLAKNYPQHKGIVTHFIAGDDHEGWYGQREGIDIGRWTERVMRENGRDDFIYLGFMEADVDLINASTGASARMRIVHPGGGSSYAISYSMQKLVESYEGGDKPAVVLGGHYHKQEILNYRNCWIIQGGTTEDQTPFMRKKKLEAHVGGMIVTLEQDPKSGAIIRCNDIYRYFNREFYKRGTRPRGERFSYGGPVTHRERTLGGI